MQLYLKPQSPGEFDHEAVWGSMAMVLLAAAAFFPFDRFPVVVCWFHKYSGIPCPSCGATRAFVAMIHGHFMQGFVFNPLAGLFFMANVIFVPYALYTFFGKKKRLRLSLDERERIPAVILIFVAVAANWIYLVLAKKV